MRAKRETKTTTTESAVEAPTANAPAEPAARSIRAICEEAILAGKTTDQVLAAVTAERPGNKTTKGCVAWYRSKMVKKGLVPSGKDTAAARKRVAEAEARSGER
jgi:hypothetical protein